jgi:hypothetical protein
MPKGVFGRISVTVQKSESRLRKKFGDISQISRKKTTKRSRNDYFDVSDILQFAILDGVEIDSLRDELFILAKMYCRQPIVQKVHKIIIIISISHLSPLYRIYRHLSAQIFILSMAVQECNQSEIFKDGIESQHESKSEFGQFKSKECFEANVLFFDSFGNLCEVIHFKAS